MVTEIGYRYPDARILVFAKAPVAGRVKTRLVPFMDDQQVLDLYQELLHDTMNRVHAHPLCPVQLQVWPDTGHPLFEQFRARYGVEVVQQFGSDLGERMYHAAVRALQNAKRVLLVGTDCPALSPGHLDAALHVLERHDVSMIPAEDGGYVLLGLRRAEPALFQDMVWSVRNVMDQTRQRLRDCGLNWYEFSPLWDVDRPEDVQRWRAGYR